MLAALVVADDINSIVNIDEGASSGINNASIRRELGNYNFIIAKVLIALLYIETVVQSLKFGLRVGHKDFICSCSSLIPLITGENRVYYIKSNNFSQW